MSELDVVRAVTNASGPDGWAETTEISWHLEGIQARTPAGRRKKAREMLDAAAERGEIESRLHRKVKYGRVVQSRRWRVLQTAAQVEEEIVEDA